MDQENYIMESEILYPILFIPKKCTTLETNCEESDNVYIDLKITSPDTEGNETCIYSGFCNIKLVDNYDVKVQQMTATDVTPESDDDIPVSIADGPQAPPSYNQSEVWIDPSRSPYVYNDYNASESQERYSICHQTHTSQITVEQHNTYITKNVYNYKEAFHYSPPEEFDHKKFRKYPETQTSSYEENEFECGVFLSQLPEEIMNEKEIKEREERKYVGLQSENGALKQLMSSDIQSVSKQRKTILFLGPDSHCGQTLQKIAITDPMMQCPRPEADVDHEVVIDDSDLHPKQKKYQCAKCQQIFHQISDFRAHMVNHKRKNSKFGGNSRANSDVKFLCIECGKNLKTRQKFDLHCLGHGDPELECNKCHKVFASKFTLRAHRKIHSRKYPCRYCTKTYSKIEDMRAHTAKIHFTFMCTSCDFVASKYTDLTDHEAVHENFYVKDSSETDFAESFLDDVMSESDIITPSPEGHWKLEDEPDQYDTHDKQDSQENGTYSSNYEQIKKADSVLAKVMSNEMFLSKKPKRYRRYNKACDVCYKTFDRVSDLKRHLIEHVVRNTLAKTPVNRSGALNIQCEVCQSEVFTRIDRYKAHLREHAKLTLYQCTFCNKSFSDSSNFSKHKKIHGDTYFQCDLCQRKFNSKKMISQHMEYHNKNTPLTCQYCGKLFHFESMLNKHIKGAHTRELRNRFRCKFCHNYFKTLKDKWDHEWSVHNIRKMVVDCLICGSKFRKYAELKRHCNDVHNVDIPPAKKLLRKKSRAGPSRY